VSGSTPASTPRSAPVPASASSAARRLAELGLLATAAIWSANFVLVKAVIGVMGPMTFAGARFVVASVTLLVILRWRQGSVRPPAGRLPLLLLLGVLGFGCYQLLWTVGLTQVSAGDSALIIAASPVLVALLAAAVGMDTLTAPKLAGALLAFAGVAVVIGGGHELTLGSSLMGALLTLGAAAVWAVYTIAGTRVIRRVDPLTATTWTVIGGTLFLVPIAVAEAVGDPGRGITLPALLAIVASGALAVGICNVLVFNAIRFVGPTRATAMQLLVPAGAVILGAVLLAEPVGVPQVVGGVVIVVGVWLTRRPRMLPARPLRRIPAAR
jgi:drug/metabolite transporter (DMT)-like permease